MMTKTGELNIDMSDEITRDSIVVRDSEIASPRVQALLTPPVKS
jgi:hypothetical protein